MNIKSIKKDIAIIGAGIIGCSIARELSRYKETVVVIEKEVDVGWGTTKANSGIIHVGYADKVGTLRLNLSHKGNIIFRKYAQELDIQIKNVGSFVNALDKSQICILEELLDRGKGNGISNIEIITNNKNIKKIEPNISDKVCAALYTKEACIVSPYESAIALYENARENSIKFLFDSEVSDIIYNKSANLFNIKTPYVNIEASFIINCAGVFSDRIAMMIGDNSFSINPVKGQYLVFDVETYGFVNSINFNIPVGESKGVLITPTVDKNFIVGPNYEKANRSDVSTTKEGLEGIRQEAEKLFPNIPYNSVIASFAGLRAVSDSNDFIVGPSPVNNKFINVAGIQSPGLTCAFSIAELVIDILKDLGLKLRNNNKFVPVRKRMIKFDKVSLKKKIELFRKNDQYGEIICRCEKVTKAEIVKEIRKGVYTLDGIKFRTRAGMGRCQGGYCTLKVMKILARELNVPFEEITKAGKDSYIVKERMN